MDYKAIIKRGHNWNNNHFRQELNEPRCIIAEMSAAIETLLAEREAAVADLTSVCVDSGDTCRLCKHLPCVPKHEKCVGWEWRSPTPHDRQQAESQKDKPKEIYNDGKYRAVVVVE